MAKAAMREMRQLVREQDAEFGADFGTAEQRQAIYDRVSHDLVQNSGTPLTKRQEAVLAQFVANLPVRPMPRSARRLARLAAGISVFYGALVLLNLVVVWGSALPLVGALILTLIVLALGVGFVMSGISLWRRLDGAHLTPVMIMGGLIAVMSLRAASAVGVFALVGLVPLITMVVTARMARRAICAPLTLFGQAIRNRSTGQWRF